MYVIIIYDSLYVYKKIFVKNKLLINKRICDIKSFTSN